MGPLVWMLYQFQQGNEVDPKVGKGAIKSSLNLLGNASAHFSVERRKAIMKHLKKDLKPMAENEFSEVPNSLVMTLAKGKEYG